MMAKPDIKSDGRTITVRVPISIRRRGGRKVVLAPDGSMDDTSTLHRQQLDGALVKAIARAFRWRDLLERGTFGTITELAQAEHIDHSYVGRILRLTLLAPDIIGAILERRQPGTMTLADLLQPLFNDWAAQRSVLRLQADDPSRASIEY